MLISVIIVTPYKIEMPIGFWLYNGLRRWSLLWFSHRIQFTHKISPLRSVIIQYTMKNKKTTQSEQFQFQIGKSQKQRQIRYSNFPGFRIAKLVSYAKTTIRNHILSCFSMLFIVTSKYTISISCRMTPLDFRMRSKCERWWRTNFGDWRK